MAKLTVSELRAVAALADHLYDYLPGTAHPHANQSISFAGAADSVGLRQLWSAGSKKPAISLLLQKTLELQRGKFCSLIEAIVSTSFNYPKHSVSREKVEQLNLLVKAVGFKIPSLWDKEFLRSLPTDKPAAKLDLTRQIAKLKNDLTALTKLQNEKQRGYSFESFLNELFTVHGLQPRSPFKVTGEQIDGSIELDSHTYLLEARWRAAQANNGDLLILKGKAESKATWSRGIFISYSGFTNEGLAAYKSGKATNLICFCGQDLYLILENKLGLKDVIQLKSRKAAEEGLAYVPVFELLRHIS